MLRLKGERDSDERDEITREDIFPGDETSKSGDEEYGEVDPGRPRWTLPLRGLGVAAGTFAPTFLLIFLGLPYVLGSAAPARTPTTPGPGPLASLGPDLTPSPKPSASEVLRGDVRSGPASRVAGDWLGLFSSPPAADEPKVESPQSESKLDEPAPAAVPEAGPSLPPNRLSQAEPSPAPEPRAPEASPPAATTPAPSEPRAPEARPIPEPRRAATEPRQWTPAAAFTDRASAGRLASSIEKQGYPVEIRQDSSSSRPWVVWIGAEPSGGSRRR